MKTIVRLLIRAGVPERTMIVILYRALSVLDAVESELETLYWLAIIKLYRALDWTGAHALAEWFARASGLRACLKAALGYGDETDR